MAIKNKKEIEIFYKTHDISLKDLARHFNVKYRTIAHWAQKEQWKRAECIKNITEIHSPVVEKNVNKIIDIAEVKIKNQIKQNLKGCFEGLDQLILDNLLQSSTDEILLKTMSANFIQKNIALCAVLAKSQLIEMVQNKKDMRDNPVIIACAEKVAKIFADMKIQLYGRDPVSQEVKDNNYDDLTSAQLKLLINELEIAENG